MRTTVTLTAQGKVTIPKPLREELDLEEGDLLEIEVEKV